ncbi:MAG: hypothetical protein NT085_05320 [candidate division SR1 bacterium]|nr:hypothetical protein [candidate division SR1 bacterium]
MATTLNKNLELISGQEQVKSKKDQMLENLKLEMIKGLKLDQKLIERNTVTKKLTDSFVDFKIGDIDWTESFGKKDIKIDEKKYRNMTERYKEIIKLGVLNPDYKKKKIEWCRDLAEQIILDQNKMIEFSSTEQFDGKTAEEEAKASFERLDKNDKYNKKIELIKKINGQESHFIIKRTKKQLEELERAERAYETLNDNEIQQPVVKADEPVITEGPQPGVPTLENTQQQTVNTLDDATKEALRKMKKELEAMKIGETTDLTMPDGKIIRLQKKDEKGWVCLTNQVPEFNQYIDKDHFVVENGNKSYISYVSNESLWKFLNIPDDDIIIPTPIPEPIEEEEGELGPVELTATISDTTQITRAIAERQAGEKLRKIYKNTARYKPRSRPTKAVLFLGRGYMKDHYTRKYMNMKKGMQRDENLVKGADRHEMEEENKFNEAIKNVGNIDENNYPRTYAALDVLAKQMTGDGNTLPPRQRGINDTLFQQQFTAIIRRNLDTTRPATATDANRKPLAQIIKSNDIQQMSSNITLKLNGFRDHQEMSWDIADHITRNPTEADTTFNAFSRARIIKYFNTYKKNPEFLKTMKIRLDDPTAMQELRRLQAHNGALTQIAAQTMKLKVQILVKGEEAYNVKQERGIMTKIGNRLDKPISDKSRFGKWMEKHPFVKNAFGTLRGITKLGAMITPAILLAPLGPLAVAGGAGGMAFAKTLFKKYAHYNKEHIGYQRNQATNLLNNTAERDRLMNEMSQMNPASRFMLYYFGLGKKARDVRQFRDYVMTTHDQLENSDTLGTKMEGLLNKPQLTPAEQQELEKYISEGLARLDFHKKTGQNFLGSKDKDVAEKEYQNIYRLVLTGSIRLNQDLDILRQNNYYDNEMDLINNGTGDEVDQIGYQKSRKRFKHRQTEKALLGAVKAGGVAFGLSYLATSLASTKESTTTLSDKTSVKENFVLGGHESSTSNGIYDPAKTFFDAGDTAGKNVAFPYGGGTDITHVVAGHLTPAEYATKVAEVSKEISAMGINPTTKANLLSELTKQPWLGVTGQANAALHNMRCVELIEQGAKALNDSTNAASIIITPHYAPSVFDITAATYNNAAERVAQGALGYSQEITTAAHTIPIPIPGYMNTFKEPDRYDEEGKPRKGEQERKTRSPAPKVKPQTESRPARRRSGESIEDTQFTNSNN